jgi:lipid II:glycine glycyltransferase (peptidoglycan interpeptide bridge formation enzyme)
MIISTRSSVRIADLYFDERAADGLKVDIIRHNQSPTRLPGAICTPFPTIVLDLTQSPEDLLAKMKSHTRYKIRRAAEKDGLEYIHAQHAQSEAFRAFVDHMDECNALKNLPRVSRERLLILAGRGALDVSFVRDSSGAMLAASSFVVTTSRVRGLYAGASYRGTNDPSRRSLIGRANRYLYWRDILRFRDNGIRTFDFGGYYTGDQDEEKVRINGFKDEFGGVVINEFNCEQPRTVKGRIALWFLHRRERRIWQKRVAAAAGMVKAPEQHESSVSTSI